jgi:NTP pyrophosphatase (non-canonical NTP hydrolase)
MIDKILEWCKIAGIKQEGSEEQASLWINLMNEEFSETVDAINAGDKEEQADGLADLVWVICNWAHMNNIDIITTLKKVEISNYSKFCKTIDEALETCEAYRQGKHWDKLGVKIDTKIEKVGDVYIVKRLDDKVLKSINYITVKEL